MSIDFNNGDQIKELLERYELEPGFEELTALQNR